MTMPLLKWLPDALTVEDWTFVECRMHQMPKPETGRPYHWYKVSFAGPCTYNHQ
jgi:hypothetical protein